MTLMTRFFVALHAACVLALLALTVALGDELPARIPLHFGANGQIDGWTNRSSWYLLPGIGAATFVLMTGLVIALPSRPELLNHPDKARLLRLPKTAQRAVIERITPVIAAMGLLVGLVFPVIQYAVWQGAHGRSTQWLGVTPFVLAGLPLLALPLLLTRLPREITRQEQALGRDAAAATRPPRR
ncbi:MAG: DUF1648 domain-containing protein [Gemmatimonadaceae bacterium]|jgi:hypothetical protein|nr:DUF1648 domain-containing protein [Gemmatimonadaceae bacterium]